ncbi:MAG: serine/threonine protein kinase [Polyangiaceae bacterium]|nr:serine/threonine protein kinase [Polyangiaceae bacterium]
MKQKISVLPLLLFMTALTTVAAAALGSALTLPVSILMSVMALVHFISSRREAPVQQSSGLEGYGEYELLGEGSMGRVYRARHLALSRLVALKKIKTENIGDIEIHRFQREAKVLSQLENTHTIQIFDYGTTAEGEFFFAMELLHGLDLQLWVDRFGPLNLARTKRIMMHATAALAEAHRLGIVHRDLKPANLMLCHYGGEVDFLKILDFGLVKLAPVGTSLNGITRESVVLGTPAYLAPESLFGSHSVNAAVDVYALGAIAHFLLSGTLLFNETRPMVMAQAHLQETPPSLADKGVEIPPALEKLILQCLAKDAQERPTCEELLAGWEAIPVVEEWQKQEAETWWRNNLPEAFPKSSESSPLSA